MPIDLNLFNKPINRNILVKGEDLVGTALHQLESKNGESWWHIVVMLGEGRFAATQFNSLSPLAQSKGSKFFDRSLSSLVDENKIPIVLVVERSALGTEAAKDLAYESPGRVLVVTEEGEFLGIIYQGEAGGNFEEKSLLSMFKEHTKAASKDFEGAEPEATRPQHQERYIQAQVYELLPEAQQVIAYKPLQADHDYHVIVRIGPLDPEWLGPPPEASFPDDQLPWTEEFYHLQVVFFEPFHAPEPQVQTITLPIRGPSSTAEFDFHTIPDRVNFEARIVMLFENRIMQTALMRSTVLTSDQPDLQDGELGLHLIIEAVVRNNLSRLERDQVFGAALVLNHNNDGEPSMQTFAGETSLVISLGEVDHLIDEIKNELGDIYRSPERFEEGLRSESTQKLLSGLAILGSQLYDTLLQFRTLDHHPLFKENRLQIVTTNVASFLPLEYIYDRLPPSPDHPVPLCGNAEEALRTGNCQCDLEDESEAVCPLGFWGMRKVIERFAFNRPSDTQFLDSDDFKVFAGINGARDELTPFKQIIYAASERVDKDQDHPNQIQAVLNVLQDVSGNKTHQVFDWTQWREGVEQDRPSLLVLLPHNTINPVRHTIRGLVISEDQTRWYTELRRQDVWISDFDERPMVMLLGCETMPTDVPYESFVAKFLSLGAAIVLGTTTSVLGYHAAPVAGKIAEIMQAIIVEDNISFGDVMLRLRRQAMLDGYPMVLTLFAYGDAGWKLIPARN